MPPIRREYIGWIGVQATEDLIHQAQGDGLLAHLQTVQGGDRHAGHARNDGIQQFSKPLSVIACRDENLLAGSA